MKKITIVLFVLLFFMNNISLKAQEDKYKVIQGIGYLHTQVTMLIVHWKKHPLNHKALDAHEAKLQEHIISELEHDEEWIEYMMVEANLSQFSENFDKKTKFIIKKNLKFYHTVISSLNNPKEFSENLPDWLTQLKDSEINLYNYIYPALCK
ncbi:MAG: hypothetical protein MK207_01855 [Saprospiraceae bacterium]|nr:hypothetical protein [Saprospiraceae bacterium]